MKRCFVRKKHKILIYTAFIFIILIIIIAVAFTNIMKSIEKETENIKLNPVLFSENLKNTGDGVYEGEYFLKELLGAKIEMSVKNHKIEYIKITEHKNGKGKPAEIITEYVTDAQSTDVDIITDATYSSKFILKAIENSIQ